MSDQIKLLVKKYDEALKKAESESYNLSIQLSMDGIAFCIFDRRLNKFQSIEVGSFETILKNEGFSEFLHKVVNENEWLSLRYHSISIIYECKKSTLIPVPLFTENEKETYSEFNFKLDENSHINYEKLSNLDAVILYEIPDQIMETFKTLFPSHRLISQPGVLIESLLILNKNLPAQKKFFVNVRNSALDILIIDKRQLLYFNSFEYKSIEDFIYFVIFVLDQLQINPEEVDLVLSGSIDKNSELFEILYKYVRNIRFQTLPDTFNYSYVFNEVPAHYYFNLISQSLCE